MSTLSPGLELRIAESPDGEPAGLLVLSPAGPVLDIPTPIVVRFLGGPEVRCGYSTWTPTGSGAVGRALVAAVDAGTVELTDEWSYGDEPGVVRVERRMRVLRRVGAPGFQAQLAMHPTPGPCRETAGPDEQPSPASAKNAPWLCFIPGALYGLNDTDRDGVEDYLGALDQDLRDDRLASRCVGLRNEASGLMYGLARVDLPVEEVELSSEQLRQRRFVTSSPVGSLGVAPELEGAAPRLRACFPFLEERSWCLNVNGDGWEGYAPLEEGREYSVTYLVSVRSSASLTDGIWSLVCQQRRALATSPRWPDHTLSDGLAYRQALTQSYYREWEGRGPGGTTPAGFMVHFSPRDGRTLGALLEFGFSGAQTLLAWASLEWGRRTGDEEAVRRGRRVNDFFVDACQLDNGFTQAMYDVDLGQFVYWFSGILYPFQHSADETELRRALGRQVTEVLAPIATQLAGIEGNYMRSMCESVYSLVLSYETELTSGHRHERWLEAAERFARFLLQRQAPDGSWRRAYTVDGDPVDAPAAWFGASDIELKSGTIFPIEVLVALARVTGNVEYVDAARRAGDYVLDTHVQPVEYVGGLNDTTHVKCVKGDSSGVMFVMRSLLHLWETTREERFLTGARDAARILCSWVYLWDLPFPEGSLLRNAAFRSTGWAACEVMDAGSYVDNQMLEFTGDMMAVAVACGDEVLFDIAEAAAIGLEHGLSVPSDMLGYAAPGIQCEGYLLSYWLSDPGEGDLEFSGAVGKRKGADNDTCNGLVNGQALYGWTDIERRFGTNDLKAIRESAFGGSRRRDAPIAGPLP